ncbi:unnamed protein product [Periconia digitata]|uniref:Uncharacterized protein n=1 Tax=Periconia digitata TaxID=1303443 RepID=A0A9W4XKG1_9PLEO|nr:unnamed protein product [Periconia digitata]
MLICSACLRLALVFQSSLISSTYSQPRCPGSHHLIVNDPSRMITTHITKITEETP